MYWILSLFLKLLSVYYQEGILHSNGTNICCLPFSESMDLQTRAPSHLCELNADCLQTFEEMRAFTLLLELN